MKNKVEENFRIIFKVDTSQQIVSIFMKELATGEQRKVGQIVTPSGTGRVNEGCIQVCGFEEAFDYWGCGVFSGSKSHKARKDIQMMFNFDTTFGGRTSVGECYACYNQPCTCDIKGDHRQKSPYTVIRREDLVLKKL